MCILSWLTTLPQEEEEEIMIMEKWITSLPQEILIEILSRIPANSLVSSFKLVCKAWCTLIHDPDFINKMHLNRGAIHGGTSLIRKTRTSNIGTRNRSRSGNKLFQLKPPFNYEGFVIAPKINLDVDFNLFSSYSSRLVGSCNGLLLCLSDSRNEMLNLGIILLNPSTKKCKISPKKPIERPSPLTTCNIATYGFGCYYNSITTIFEYKVVRIVHFHPERNLGDPQSFQFQIDIYSMSSNSWRGLGRVEGFPHDVSQNQFGLFLNEAVHWMGCKVRHGNVSYGEIIWDTIVSFNIRDEEFRQVPTPPCADVVFVDGAEYPYLNEYTILMNVRGCLGNAYFSRTEMLDVVLEIWVMKEYGIGESWTKEFVIRTSDSDPLRELSGLYMFGRYMTCFLTGDDKILIGMAVDAGQMMSFPLQMKGYGRRILYDMNKKEIDVDFVMIDIPYEYYRDNDQVDYIETLVSLKSSSPLSSPLSSTRDKKESLGIWCLNSFHRPW